MTLLFHYTSVQGLRGIVESQNFWATHYKFLNDYREGSVLNTAIRELFRKRLINFLEETITAERKQQIVSEFGSVEMLANQDAMAFEEALFGTHDRMMPSFVTSFCEHLNEAQRRNGLLSQWRAYANDGGYCLIFERDTLEGLLREESSFSKNCSIASGPVDYISDTNDADLKKFDDAFKNLIPAMVKDRHSQEESFSALFNPMLTIVPFAKDAHFSEEREFRAVLAALDKEVLKDKLPYRKPFFREINGCLVPYLSVFERKVTLPLIGVLVGPGRSAERRKLGVERFLSETGFKVEVKVSEIPYLV